MTIYTLIGLIAALAVGVSIVSAILQRPENWFVHYLRNFLGTFFIFSGVVKAIDPMGTAIKMGDYFNAFTTHFSFLTPLWDLMNGIALPIAMGMIILEIVLGVSLILGTLKRTTLMFYLGIMVVFTVLTGFTYLTGYVPKGSTFFQFSEWTSFKESSMEVKDCGCFGDFIKLKPYESFIKDVVLTILLLILIALSRSYGFITKKGLSYLILGALTLITTAFCFRNIWNLPIVDFRAYAEGTNLVKCTSDKGLDPGERLVKFIVTKDGQEKTVVMNDFAKASSDGWKYKDRIDEVIREPELPPCKDFLVLDEEGNEYQQDILEQDGVSFWVSSYDIGSGDQAGFDRINALVKEFGNAKKLGLTATEIDKANKVADGQYTFFNLDAVPIKTMNRSNPGLNVVKDGVLVAKYHHNHLPDAQELKAKVGL